jgi:hypothetical protein
MFAGNSAVEALKEAASQAKIAFQRIWTSEKSLPL